MRYLRVVIDHFCPRRTHSLQHTKSQLGWTAREYQLSFLSRLHQQMHTKVNQNDSLEEYSRKRVCFRSALYPKPAGSRLLQTLILLGPIAVSTQMHRQLHLLWTQQCFQGHLPPFQNKHVFKILAIGRTNPVTSHAVVQQDGGTLAPKAITKQPFFFKMVTLIMFVIFLIKVEITLLNNVNLTDCFTSTLSLVRCLLRFECVDYKIQQ